MKFLKTISVSELKTLLFKITPLVLGEVKLPLDDAFGRILSRDIESPIDVPHFRKSRMDGYAVIASDTFPASEDKSVDLVLVDHVQAGAVPKKEIQKGQCAYVATGAAIPEGADAVVMVEFTERTDNIVSTTQSVTPDTHIVKVGHDIPKGKLICKKNELISVSMVGLLSSCGMDEIWVYKKPKISLISTGNELVSSEIKHLDIGKIYDINSRVLKISLQNAGAEVEYLGIVKDSFETLKNAIDHGLSCCDITILSGGTSKGEGDFAPQVLEGYQDIEIMVHGVRIKPGKPFIFARIGLKLVFVLPGYPTSALSCYYIFVEDFIRRMAGYPLRDKNSISLEVGERIYSTIGRHEFKPVKIDVIEGQKKVFPIQTGSEAISTLFNADGYIEIEELESIVEKGDVRTVYFF
ncbi:MAG: molybdopterin molybdotransferase MoeA [Candidatus Lokiarchaeota archaeon]|nr:molybdopterin molybdotransferase MoeA [Candidatus Lokiarchaeota archaeon]